MSAPHDEIVTAHRRAMDAKEQVFLAQDAVSRAWSVEVNAPRRDAKRQALLKKIEKRLARVRGELEQLDNAVLWAQQDGTVVR